MKKHQLIPINNIFRAHFIYNRCIPSSFNINKELSDVLPDMQNYEQPNLSNISLAVSGIENFLELYHYSWYHTVANDLRTAFFPDLFLIILISTGFTIALFHLLMFASSCCGGSKTCQAAYWLNYSALKNGFLNV